MAVMSSSSHRSAGQRLGAFFALCKPRVNSLIVFTAMIGMFLAAPSFPPFALFIAASVGIALVAGAAAAINCLIEQNIDALMARTRARPTARGEVSATETLTLATFVGGLGLWVLHTFVNPLTMWLTLATFLGYALIYTVLLKPATPMNIVIGGASGAMPPLLGWSAITGHVGPEALVLFLIIFIWTPPHFWALACYRCADYAKSGLPMLPVTHGINFTCLHSLLYVIMLSAATVLPYTLGMSGAWYLATALILDAVFLVYSFALWRDYSDKLARLTFRYSIIYLTLLFAALLVDHFLR
ncbi:MAG: protoheme IX farnesyltransferase [Candidatus Accumulibacter sp.]|jgi:protoheme IX farnesyltransferase|uniref:heme o synthase n=1 Tax=Accumulibacter sp. TaxID=2053492 RepID=UPI00258CC77B|nr:heme o synthase [Accumulibacter sp.]MBK8114526.1 protoheme IX farnesyltransferase [Accumulibacter sp.]